MTDTTLLRLSPISIPPYSARGIEQTLEHIEQAAVLRRTVNGQLRNVAEEQFRRYRSTITCNDQQAPALSGVWPGRQLVVDCIVELSHEDATDASAERTVVPGSTRTANGFVFYRPRLTMLVVSYRTGLDEYGAACNWALELEEV